MCFVFIELYFYTIFTTINVSIIFDMVCDVAIFPYSYFTKIHFSEDKGLDLLLTFL